MKPRCLVVGAVLAAATLAAGCDAGERCGPGTTEVDGACVPAAAECGPGTTSQNGECVPDGSVICETGTRFEDGVCVPDIIGCAAGTVLVEGQCVPEDQVRDSDVQEAAEPNDRLLAGDSFAAFDLPAEGEDILLAGCIQPYRDVEPADGDDDIDLDAFLFEAAGPTLLDVTVDGVGGATGGFVMVSEIEELADDGWLRRGITLTGDTTRQQVYLPAAGVYRLIVSDSRSLASGQASGGPGACYYATVARLAIPAPSPIDGQALGILGPVQFWSYVPTSDGEIIRTEVQYNSQSAAAGLVQMVNDGYRGSASVAIGQPASITLAGLVADDRVVLVVEPITNYSLRQIETSLTVTPVPSEELPTDGTPLTLTHDDANPFHYLFFRASAGELLRVEFDPGSIGYDVLLYPGTAIDLDFAGSQWIADLCLGCDEVDSWVQLQETGLYYLTIHNFDAEDGETYQVGFTVTRSTPEPLTVGTAMSGDLAGGRSLFESSLSGLAWLDFSVQPTGFDEARVRFYRRNAAGELDELVRPVDEGLSAGAPFRRVLDGAEGPLLVAVDSAAGAGGGETFSLLGAPRPHTDAGVLDPETPLALADIPVAGDQPALVLVRAQRGAGVVASVIDDSGAADLRLEQIDPAELALVTSDGGGPGASEQVTRVARRDFVAYRVSVAGGQAASFDLDVEQVPGAAAASSPAMEIPDASGGFEVRAGVARPCAIAGITVDVDIAHPYRGDIELRLTSPAGTEVQLKAADQDDDGDDVAGTYPDDLAPVGDLDAFLGEEASGTWTLTVADVFLSDSGILDGWGVYLFCE